MPRIFAAIFVLAIAAATNLCGVEAEVDPSSPPKALTMAKAALDEAGPTTCTFTESRSFPFKKAPTILEGESDYLPRQGIILRYHSPEKRTLGIRSDGIVETEPSGAKTLRALPRQYENMLTLYDLDLRKLADDFNIYFDGDDTAWTIRLAEKPHLSKGGRQHEAGSVPLGITIRGAGCAVRSLEIAKPGAISITIRMDKARRMTPEEAATAAEELKP
jgi:hypothetical protein